MKKKKYTFRIREVNYQYLDNENNVQNTKFYTLAEKEKFLGIFPVWREFVMIDMPHNPTAQFESEEAAMTRAVLHVREEAKKRERKIKEKQLKSTMEVVRDFNLDGDGEVL